MIRMIIEIDPLTNKVAFDGRHSAGQKLSRLEVAYYTSKIISALIKDGMHEKNNGLVLIGNGGGVTTQPLNS